MSDNSKQLPHIQLKLTTEGTANSFGGGSKKETQTASNLSNRQGHGSRIKQLRSSVVNDWQTAQEKAKYYLSRMG